MFNNLPVYFIREPTYHCDISQVVDDNVLENEEVFLVRLNVSFTDPLDEDELEGGTHYLLIRIMPDSGDGKPNVLQEYSKTLCMFTLSTAQSVMSRVFLV